MRLRPKGLFVEDAECFNMVYGPDERDQIRGLIDIYAPDQTPESVKSNPSVLRDAELIMSGWGAPQLDESFLSAAPNLRVFFYAGGSVRGVVTKAFWDRDIQITSAYAANAVSVAEFTLSQIIFCLKQGWYYVLNSKKYKRYIPRVPMAGCFGSTVGIVSLGMIGRCVCNWLKQFDVNVVVYDPFADESVASELEIELCSLEEVFRRADVVSLHTPLIEETTGMIGGEHFALMKENAAFINTAQGAVIREEEMVDVIRKRSDLHFVLDVTHPEPPEPDSPLYELPNVILTPHVAGCMDRECLRMAQYMIDELKRYLQGKPLKWGISQEQMAILA